MIEPPPAPPPVAAVRIGKLTANLVAVPIGLLLLGLCVATAWALPHAVPPDDYDLWLFLVSVFPLVAAHEALHAAAAVVFGGVRPRDLRVGVYWKALTPYCHCRVPLRVGAYRRVALTPFYITILLGVGALYLHPALWVAMLLGTALAGCVGDLWVYFQLRRFPADYHVADHPQEIGCDVYASVER
ncbi:DUF3267 domain-containing protein [bacterium]|nr:DUF3267 domain-containing protein [bacterium]